MKRMYYYLFSLFFALSLRTIHAQEESNKSASFGKTHFIIGLPKEEYKEQKSLPQKEDQKNIPSWAHSSKPIRQAFFSPDDDIKKILLDLIAHEEKDIKISIFMLTDKTIAQALIDAKNRGVDIEIIADGACNKDRFSKIKLLQDAGIKVYVYQAQGNTVFNEIMHHKFVIFKQNIHQKSLLWTGSFNFTKSANDRNHENVLVIEESAVVDQYSKKFEELKQLIHKNKNSKEDHSKITQTKQCLQKVKREFKNCGRKVIKNILT